MNEGSARSAQQSMDIWLTVAKGWSLGYASEMYLQEAHAKKVSV